MRPGKESSYWKDVTADMMSDEERVGDIYLRHPPSYRSEKFHKFLMKLDERAATKSNSHARFKRQEGSIVEKTAPMNCKPWMIKKGAVTEESSRSSTVEARPSESETLIVPAAAAGVNDISSEAELSSDCD